MGKDRSALGKFIFGGIALLIIIPFLTHMNEDDGLNPFRWFWIILIIVGTVLLINGITKNNNKLRANYLKAENFKKEFFDAIEKANFKAINKWHCSPFFGLAINDDMESIAVFIAKRLRIYRKDKLISCETRDVFSETITNKTKASIIIPTATTKGVITKTFSYAELLITVDDLTSPVIKLIVPNKEEAEKYIALINGVIRNKAVTTSSELPKAQSDKLLQLFEMFKEGLLTEEEFNKQKQMLLSN